jgi:hypothetical protein
MKQYDPKTRLKFCDATRHSWRRDTQFARGSGEPATFGDGHEHLKCLKSVHSLFHILK